MAQTTIRGGTLERAARGAVRGGNPWVERLARAGLAARGVVYGFVGALALEAAAGVHGGQTTDARGALRAIAVRSRVLLWAVAVGFAGYALWRLVQALADPENRGRGARGLARRGGALGIAVIYSGLAVAAVRLALGARPGGGYATSWTATLLALPFGRWLVAMVGLGVIVAGCHQVYAGFTCKFRQRLLLRQMSASEQAWALRLGRLGTMARGAVFALMGLFLVRAALDANAREANGLGGALAALARQPYGPWLLGSAAAGLVAFGLYSLVEARYRRIVL
jgi:uncharacterized protein DUF1206